VNPCKTLGNIQEVQLSGEFDRHLEHKDVQGEQIPGVK
jgi:hypothetical protein